MASVLGAGASLIGSVIGAHQSSANVNKQLGTQRAENRLNRYFNRSEAQKARDFQQQLINSYRAYNSPKAVMQRLQDAGLNPNMAMGQIGGGDTSSMSAPNGASSSGGISPVGYHPIDTAATANILANARKTNAEADQAEAAARKSNEEAITTDALRDGLVKLQDQTFELGELTKKIKENEIPKIKQEVAALAQSVEESKGRLKLLSQQTESVKEDVLIKRLDRRFKEKTFQFELARSAAEAGMSITEYKYSVASFGLRLMNLKADTSDKLASAYQHSALGRLANAQSYEQEDRNKYILPRLRTTLIVQNNQLLWNYRQCRRWDDVTKAVNNSTQVSNSLGQLLQGVMLSIGNTEAFEMIDGSYSTDTYDKHGNFAGTRTHHNTQTRTSTKRKTLKRKR